MPRRAKIQSTDYSGSTAQKIADRKYLYRKGGYIYFRFKDGSLRPLPADASTIEFKNQYEHCLRERQGTPGGKPPHDRRARKLKEGNVAYGPGTVGRFILLYKSEPRSPFQDFKPRTQYNYIKALDLTRARLGTGLLADLDQEGVEVFIAEIAREYGTSTGDLQKNLLSNLWKFARGYREFKRGGKHNPTIGIEKLHKTRKPVEAWPQEIQDTFLATAKGPLVDAFHLLKFTAQRGVDVVKMKWTDIEADDDGHWYLTVIQEKTGNKIYHRLPVVLADRLKALPRISEFVLTSNWKRPWRNATTLSHAIRRHFDKLGLPRFKMHGLRATAAAEIASFSGGTEGIKAITGHVSDRMARHYARAYDQRRVNAATVDLWDAEIARLAAAKVTKRRRAMRAV